MTPLSRKDVLPLIRLALREDAAAYDLTSRCVLPSTTRIQGRIVAKAPGILAGGPLAVWTFLTVDQSLRCTLRVREGAALHRGQTVLTVEGRARSIFAAERTALNFLGHLSGIASLTHAFVQRVKPFHAKILDTRKTLPGLRLLEKYAVRIGGGRSHRRDLCEAILIKTNHLLAYSGQRIAYRKTITDLVGIARRKAGRKFVEIEVTNLQGFDAALRAKPDAILLDNWTIRNIQKAVACLSATRYPLDARPLLEVSGGVALANVRAIAKSGVDRISIGRLTHSAQALDISLEVNEVT